MLAQSFVILVSYCFVVVLVGLVVGALSYAGGIKVGTCRGLSAGALYRGFMGPESGYYVISWTIGRGSYFAFVDDEETAKDLVRALKGLPPEADFPRDEALVRKYRFYGRASAADGHDLLEAAGS